MLSKLFDAATRNPRFIEALNATMAQLRGDKAPNPLAGLQVSFEAADPEKDRTVKLTAQFGQTGVTHFAVDFSAPFGEPEYDAVYEKVKEPDTTERKPGITVEGPWTKTDEDPSE